MPNEKDKDDDFGDFVSADDDFGDFVSADDSGSMLNSVNSAIDGMGDWDIITDAEATEAALSEYDIITEAEAAEAAAAVAAESAAAEGATAAAAEGGLLSGIMGGLGQFALMSIFFSPPVMSALGDFIKPAADCLMRPWSPLYWASSAVKAIGHGLDDFFNLITGKPKLIRVKRKKLHEADVKVYEQANKWKQEDITADRFNEGFKKFKTQEDANKAWLKNFFSDGNTMEDLDTMMEPGYFILNRGNTINQYSSMVRLKNKGEKRYAKNSLAKYRKSRGISMRKTEKPVEIKDDHLDDLISDDELNSILSDDGSLENYLSVKDFDL